MDEQTRPIVGPSTLRSCRGRRRGSVHSRVVVASAAVTLLIVAGFSPAFDAPRSVLGREPRIPGDPPAATPPAGALAPIIFDRDIRPILSDRCFQCHGFDEAERKAGLRLDDPDGAFARLDSGERAIVPGAPDESEMIRRLRATDPGDVMPPPDSHRRVSSTEIALLERWVREGAEYPQHWAFRTPTAPDLDAIRASLPPDLAAWARTAIDACVARGFEERGLSPEPPADRDTWLRRVTFDLTGLPPTPEERAAFIADETPEAYERVVDRLLASPRYGEHFARPWLDAARYGDTHGLHLDNERSMWKYRDWVVEAFDENLPFDEFTTWQLAGDLLPEPTLDQRVATGFNRCHVTTSEGGAIDAEYLAKYAMDRVDTFGTVWLGLTLGCAQCHDHKFDPISQREYYELFAYFDNTAEAAMDGNALLPNPVVAAPTPAQAAELTRLSERVEELAAQLEAPDPEMDAAQEEWIASERQRLTMRWRAFDTAEAFSVETTEFERRDDGSFLARGPVPDRDTYKVCATTSATDITALRVEALLDDSLVGGGPGRAHNGNLVLVELEVEAIAVADRTRRERVGFQHAFADFSQDGFPVAQAIDGNLDPNNGWAVDGHHRHRPGTAIFIPKVPFGFDEGTEVQIRLRHTSQHAKHSIGRLRVTITTDPAVGVVRSEPWSMIGPFPAANAIDGFQREFGPEGAVPYPQRIGDLEWIAKPDFADGRVHSLPGGPASATYLRRVIHAPEARRVRFSLGSDDGLHFWLNGEERLAKNVGRGAAPDQEFVDETLRPGENVVLFKVNNQVGPSSFYFRMDEDAERVAVEELVLRGEATWTEPERAQVRRYFRRHHSSEWKRLERESQQAIAARDAYDRGIPRTLVIEERSMARTAHLLVRGQYDQPGDAVEPGVPDALPPLPEARTADRLELARWLVDPDHPLTARVTVNRFWQHYFGRGIVATPEDFGAQGAWPTHPELLDHLATEFVASGWDVKALQRAIVLSQTYRQSSRATDTKRAHDPDNRWLARGPRFRLDAEVIRDAALSVSGLLVEKRGGRGVRPYQPDGVWEAVGYTSSNTAKYARDSGEGLYRRSLYTFLKRTAPPPNMAILDAPSRETCVVRRERTNTPLAALVLLNDPQFVEAARVFASRLRRETDGTPEAMVDRAVDWVLSRRATDDERRELVAYFDRERAAFAEEPEAAAQLLAVGEAPRDDTLPPADHAAWTLVTSLLLNLDEAVSR